MAKIIYFTAGAVATTDEKADIDKLNALTEVPFEVVVRRGDSVGTYSYGAGLEASDYVSGTVPTAFNARPVVDPDNPPSGLPATQAIVSNAQALAVPVTGTYTTTATFTVAGGAITGIVLS